MGAESGVSVPRRLRQVERMHSAHGRAQPSAGRPWWIIMAHVRLTGAHFQCRQPAPVNIIIISTTITHIDRCSDHMYWTVLVRNNAQFNLKSDITEKHSPSHASTQTVGWCLCHWLKLKLCTSTLWLAGHAHRTAKKMHHEASTRRAHIHRNFTRCSSSWLRQLLACSSV